MTSNRWARRIRGQSEPCLSAVVRSLYKYGLRRQQAESRMFPNVQKNGRQDVQSATLAICSQFERKVAVEVKWGHLFLRTGPLKRRGLSRGLQTRNSKSPSTGKDTLNVPPIKTVEPSPSRPRKFLCGAVDLYKNAQRTDSAKIQSRAKVRPAAPMSSGSSTLFCPVPGTY